MLPFSLRKDGGVDTISAEMFMGKEEMGERSEACTLMFFTVS